jgi:hypothetical protein
MKHTSDQMQVIVTDWQTSGLSKKAFCRDRNITYQTFHYWCKRVIGGPSQGFTELSVDSSKVGSGCQIIFPSGARMVLDGELSVQWLREVLK